MTAATSLRPETPADLDAIHALLLAAFDGPEEADLVSALRTDGDLLLSLVAATPAGDILGHLAISPLKSPANAAALAPVAVLPEHQGQGIGSALIHESINWAQSNDISAVFILGNPAYYKQFGFTTEFAEPFECEYAGPYFMGMRLTETEVDVAPAVYARAFARLS